MRLTYSLICAGTLMAGATLAQSPVGVTIDTPAQSPGVAIPADFVGLSFGMKALLPSRQGGHFFNPTNTPLIILFHNLGLSHLRVGGTTVESPPLTPIPGSAEIDDLFAFARAAGVKSIIYSFRLLETDPARQYAATNAAIAKYIWSHYRPELDCFALGNEPDRRAIYDQDFAITNFSSYLHKWREFATAITNAVPEATFAGPDAGSGNVSWTTRFADAEKNSGIVKVISEHFYAGGAGRGVAARQAIEDMLSPDWVTANQTLHHKVAAPVLTAGLHFRFTEANDHYSGGVPDASDSFAGALWALDFLHWWAAHGARGVDFHNTQWVANDVIALGPGGQLIINPKGYGLKAFDLGGHGSVEPVTISNPDKVNLTAYAVRGPKGSFATLINKEHGAAAREAKVTIAAVGISRRAAVIFLTSPNGAVTVKTGVALGGGSISDKEPWRGTWTRLVSDQPGQCTVTVPAASAAIVRFLED